MKPLKKKDEEEEKERKEKRRRSTGLNLDMEEDEERMNEPEFIGERGEVLRFDPIFDFNDPKATQPKLRKPRNVVPRKNIVLLVILPF